MAASPISALTPPVAPANAGAPSSHTPAADEPKAFQRELDRAHNERDDSAERPDARAESKGKAKTRVADTERAGRRAAKASDDTTANAQSAETKPAVEPRPDDTPAADTMPALIAHLLHAAPQPAAPDAATAKGEAATARAAKAVAGDAKTAALATGPGVAEGASADAPALRAQADAEATLPPVRADAAAFALPQLAPNPSPTPVANDAPASPPMREAQIAVPLASPAFGPALGAQVSLLVRDGVQQARLHLNPAELGPITVQIQIDGSNAQVNLAAEQAPTRAVLEQALPELAGALREGGLTLTGGGVSEQPRQARDDAPGGGRSHGADTGGGEPAAVAGAVTARVAPRGVVDLYA